LKNIKNLLEKPGVDARPWAIWIWNSCITRDNLVSQLNSFIEKGFGGVAIKPSRDMVPSYLSNEFFDLFKIALKLAQQGNIGVRIAEDFGLPWNNLFEAITNQNKKLRAQRLRLDHAELISGKRVFEKEICNPDDSIILISKVVNGKIILSQTRKYSVTPEKNIFSWKAPAGDWQLMIFIKEICVRSGFAVLFLMFTILIRRNITSTQYAKPSGQNSQNSSPPPLRDLFTKCLPMCCRETAPFRGTTMSLQNIRQSIEKNLLICSLSSFSMLMIPAPNIVLKFILF